jgi:hypothetical protein
MPWVFVQQLYMVFLAPSPHLAFALLLFKVAALVVDVLLT